MTLIVNATMSITLWGLTGGLRATKAVSEGQLAVHVSRSLGTRFDELGLLASDFDAMAEHLRTLLEGRQQLTRDLSHELRSPLTRIQIALGLARRSGADVVQQLNRIELETQRLDALIDQILRLSRLDDSSVHRERERVNLRELIEELLHGATLEAKARHSDLIFESFDDVYVSGSRELLGSAIENVLRNAVHYTRHGTRIVVSLQYAQTQAIVLICDQGPGVPSGDLARIFTPFYRVAGQRDPDDRGYGIGLAITARVMRLHAGMAVARNAERGGLEVELRLPALPFTAPAGAAAR
jgi:signal transduction histidine kinase